MIETLKSVGAIAAEDTRKTGNLLRHFQISKPLISLEKFNERRRVETLKQRLSEGIDVALVSDAGTPLLSDPGAFAVSELRAAGFTICPIPGPSALTALVSAAGFAQTAFHFGGFFPKKEKESLAILDAVRPLGCPIFFFESPHRILKTLDRLATYSPDATMIAGRELTKKFETIYFGTVLEVREKVKLRSLKGEWCFALKYD